MLRSDPSRRFAVERQLGQGTFATVHLALDRATGRRVAVKRAKAGVDGAARLLDREADVLRHLSPRCALVPRFLGRAEGGGLVSDALLGGSVSDLRRAAGGGPVALPEAVRLARGMLRALRAVHEAGVVHRDVKPSNFVLDEARQTVYLIDFGGARVVEGAAARAGRVGFRGSSMYASVRAHDEVEQGPPDDLWSLAFVVVDMVTGSLPWKAHVLECRRRRQRSGREEAARLKRQSLADVRAFPGLGDHPGLRRVLAYLDGLGAGEPDYGALDGMLRALERRPPPARSAVPVRKRNRREAFDTPGTDYFEERLRTDVRHLRVRAGKKRACVRCGGYARGADGRKKRRGGVSAVACSYCPGGVHLCDTGYRPCFRLFHEERRLGGQE